VLRELPQPLRLPLVVLRLVAQQEQLTLQFKASDVNGILEAGANRYCCWSCCWRWLRVLLVAVLLVV